MYTATSSVLLGAGAGAGRNTLSQYRYTPCYTLLIFHPYLYIVAIVQRRARKGGRSMSESNILDSLEKFKAKYAWDKSLVTGQPALSARAVEQEPYPNNSIEEFLAHARRAERAENASSAGVL